MFKRIKLISFLSIVGFCTYFFWYINSSKTTNIIEATTYKDTKSETLVADFETNEKKADLLYTGKVIEITGTVKEVSFLNNRNTLILQGKDNNSGVICDMNNNQLDVFKKISEGEIITIKGICKGFLKDVVMLNCIIITN